jgi:hypothetical protein
MSTIVLTGGWAVPGYGIGTLYSNPTHTVFTINQAVDGDLLEVVSTDALSAGLLGNDLGMLPEAQMGGIVPDNSSSGGPDVIAGQYGVTTTMPNLQSGLVDYMIWDDSGGTGEIYPVRIKSFVDDSSMIIERTNGYATPVAASGVIIYCSTLLGVARKLTITCAGSFLMAAGSSNIGFAAGTYVIGDGTSKVAPIVVQYISDDVYITIE